jgi:hypothetical protein
MTKRSGDLLLLSDRAQIAVGERTRPAERDQEQATAKREAEIAASGLTPLDYMLKVLRDPRAI